MDYLQRLSEAKRSYPFDRWQAGYAHGLSQYSERNCWRAMTIIDRLIRRLGELGEDASVEVELTRIQEAVESLNRLNSELEFRLIETGEREELCALIDIVASAVGVDPKDHRSDGGSIACRWRDW